MTMDILLFIIVISFPRFAFSVISTYIQAYIALDIKFNYIVHVMKHRCMFFSMAFVIMIARNKGRQ